MYVGPEKTCFLWHRKLICSESSPLAQAYARPNQPAPDAALCHHIPVLEFPSESEECFQYATQWLYERSILFNNPSLTLTDQTYKFAVRLGIEGMQNYLIDMLQRNIPNIGRLKIEGSLHRLMECKNWREMLERLSVRYYSQVDQDEQERFHQHS